MSRNKIMIVGEYITDDDIQRGGLFMGGSGYIIRSMLREIGIAFQDCFATAVFMTPPKGREDISAYLGKRPEGIPGVPAMMSGKYVKLEYAKELQRLFDEIEKEQPNVILALGSAAAWALLGTTGVKSARGAAATVLGTIPAAVGRKLSRDFKVIVSYSHLQIRKDWTSRPIGLSDMDKVRRQSDFPDLRRPQRSIWLDPTHEDLQRFEERYFPSRSFVGVDIETKDGQITCIGFAPTAGVAIVIPFWSAAAPDGNYWKSLEEELAAWAFVRRWCATYPSVFQNGLYDMHYLWKVYGIPCHAVRHDTMLLHHALQPEMAKGLGFLGSLYTDEASWKFMRKTDTLKKED